MTKTDTADVESTAAQIAGLEEAGCDIVRVAVPDAEAAEAIGELKVRTRLPLVADIHFDHRLALLALEAGADGLRINPGNIGSRRRIEEVVEAAARAGAPIRIGVNSGSLEKDLLDKYGEPTPEALVESAMRQVNLLQELDFRQIKISLKSSDVAATVRAYRLISQMVDYPLHLGVTEAGTLLPSAVKSSAGIGALLLDGIGDTLRVSVTGDPADEVRIGRELLKALGLREAGIEIISCPTCGRCSTDLLDIVERVERETSRLTGSLKVAIMGCEVNGPGEARSADVGVACGAGGGLLFSRGEVVRKLGRDEIYEALMKEIKLLTGR
jgi:(E)-4-hydroxy-3-methylbut-2-enyl-diphosphate synthase